MQRNDRTHKLNAFEGIKNKIKNMYSKRIERKFIVYGFYICSEIVHVFTVLHRINDEEKKKGSNSWEKGKAST